jgi:hypothetical protein
VAGPASVPDAGSTLWILGAAIAALVMARGRGTDRSGVEQ